MCLSQFGAFDGGAGRRQCLACTDFRLRARIGGAAMQTTDFVNYYDILELGPNATPKAIERKFRTLASRYHPDNQDTGDRSRFDLVVEAHNTLRDLGKRGEYHQQNDRHLPPFSPLFAEEAEPSADIDETLDDVQFIHTVGVDQDVSIQNNILTMLYLRRRTNVREPGIGNQELVRLSGCPPEHLEFHLWYLKAKGWISGGESGQLEITVDGVDRATLIYQGGTAQKLIVDQG
jgi:curved DNA-binding protein CbpA